MLRRVTLVRYLFPLFFSHPALTLLFFLYLYIIGKTSLLNILVGDTDPTTGKVSRHLGCRIARLQQHHYKGEQLDPNLTPLVRTLWDNLGHSLCK